MEKVPKDVPQDKTTPEPLPFLCGDDENPGVTYGGGFGDDDNPGVTYGVLGDDTQPGVPASPSITAS